MPASATKQLFEQLVVDEEGHFDQYEKQHQNIKRFGLSYLALQSFGSGAPQAAAAGKRSSRQDWRAPATIPNGGQLCIALPGF